MDSIARAVAVYLVVLLLIRLSGRRTLADLTAFDFVLLLIIGEATQQALLGDDFSVINGGLVVLTLVLIDIGMSLLKHRWPAMGAWLDGKPMLIVIDGRPLDARLARARISEADVLEAARRLQGLERMEQIKYAVLEVSGGISIIPKD